jgi:sulfatase maturation enzyme AslB (radical SAM superfamily)
MNPISENEKFNWQQQVRNNPNFCILPFIHAYVGTTGEVNLCCSAEHPPEDWRPDGQTQTLDKIWTGETYQAIRESFLNGERVSHCRRCWDADDRGGGSDRQTHNRWFRPADDFEINTVTGNSTAQPTFLDLRPGNFCNLACRMCFTRISSRVNDQHRDYPEMESVTGESYWHEVSDWLDDPVKFETVKQWIPTTKTLKLAGGEPLFMPGVIRLLRWCVENGHTHMHLDITTNGTRTQGKILSWLSHFDSVDIQLSIDGVGAVNDYIRAGSEWAVIDSAYQTYLEMDLRVNLLATVQLYNAYDLVSIVEYWNQHGARGNLVFNFVDWPRDLQIDLLPLADRLSIAEQLEAAVASIPPERRQQFRMDATLHRLRNSHLTDAQVTELRTKWVTRSDMMDRINHADLSQTGTRLPQLRDEWRR